MVSRVRPRTGRRNAAIAGATGVIAALLFLYPTSLNRPAAPVAVAQSAPVQSASVPSDGPSAEPSAADSPSTSPDSSVAADLPDPGAQPSSTSPATYTGEVISTRWGPVQVRITVVDGRIATSEAVVYPDGNGRDREINAYAVPVLNQAAVSAQSAQLDTVSGATYTSEGYVRSLQSALDAAHLG